MSKINSNLFNHHAHALDEHGDCPLCGQKLLLKRSKRGPFLGCSGYPQCEYIQPLQQHETTIKQVLAGTECPQCGSELALKQGRYGLFVGCTAYPECQHTEQLDETPSTQLTCPVCHSGQLIERKSKFGKTFYACDHYPKCKFAVNYPPKAGQCEHCGFELLVERKFAAGVTLVCANKACGKKQTK